MADIWNRLRQCWLVVSWSGPWLLLGLLSCAGCAQTSPTTVNARPNPTQPNAVWQSAAAGSKASIQLAQYTELPEPKVLKTNPATPGKIATLGAADHHAPKVLPINLDTVFRLAQDQNGQIVLAREQLNEAFANKALADKAWLPEIDVGLAYYRHEGGIQDETGQFIHSSFGSLFAGVEVDARLNLREAVYQKVDAERKIWQQRGELSRLSSEALLDAANTYIDLLTARTAEVISRDTEAKIEKLVEKAKNLAGAEPGLKVEIANVRAQLWAQQQITRELQAGARSAAAKLLQLLHLDPHSQLAVMDPRLVPFALIAPNTSTDELVAHALTDGPGIRELEGLLNLINQAEAQAHGPQQFLPTLELRLAEGAFGAGPGDEMTWDNRLDVALFAKWNLSNFCTARERQWAAHSKIQQAHISYDNLRYRLTLGVQEAVESSASNAEKIQFAQKQIDDAREAHKLSETRLKEIAGTTPSEVLRAIGVLTSAQLGYLNALRDYDKAQIRLLILTGKGPACTAP